jgi:flagellar basal body-associated protein FliL
MAKKEEAAAAPEKDAKGDSATDAATEQPAATAKKRKLVLFGGIGAGLLLVLGLGGFFVFKTLSKPKVEMAAKNAHGATAEAKDGKPADAHGAKEEAAKEDAHGKPEAKPDEQGKAEAKPDEHGKTEAKPADGAKKDEHSKETDKRDGKSDEIVDTKKLSSDFGEIYELPKMDLNLGNPLENRFLRLALTIEYTGKDTQKDEIKKREPQLKDILISAVSAKSRIDLLSEKGKERLRRELTNRYNEILDKPIKSIYFTEFLVE